MLWPPSSRSRADTKLIKLQLPLTPHLPRNTNPSPGCNPPLPPCIQTSVRHFTRACSGSLWANSHSQPHATLLGLTEFFPSCFPSPSLPAAGLVPAFFSVLPSPAAPAHWQPCQVCATHDGMERPGPVGEVEHWTLAPCHIQVRLSLITPLITGIIGFLY